VEEVPRMLTVQGGADLPAIEIAVGDDRHGYRGLKGGLYSLRDAFRTGFEGGASEGEVGFDLDLGAGVASEEFELAFLNRQVGISSTDPLGDAFEGVLDHSE